VAEDAPYTLEWYIDETGRNVVQEWILDDLTPAQRRTIGVAMFEILQHEGQNVVESEFGKALGEGLYEFRVRQHASQILKRTGREQATHGPETGTDEKILLRVFFHPHGDKLILLVGGYDKGANPAERHQQKQIELARKRLEEWKRSGRSET
jgi:hypothetical protein